MMVVETIGEIPLYLAEYDRIVMGGLVALLSYIVGALIYLFVKMRNHKEEIHTHWVQSRLQSLQTQLNPHFLFNALNSVAELIHTSSKSRKCCDRFITVFATCYERGCDDHNTTRA